MVCLVRVQVGLVPSLLSRLDWQQQGVAEQQKGEVPAVRVYLGTCTPAAHTGNVLTTAAVSYRVTRE